MLWLKFTTCLEDHTVSKYWNILLLDTDLKKLLPCRSIITFSKGCSIMDYLVRSHFMAPHNEDTWLDRKLNGYFCCGKCKMCRFFMNSQTFRNATTGQEYIIRDFIKCKSVGVVYLATHPCPLDYIGKTQLELSRRITDHIRDRMRNWHSTLKTYKRMSQWSAGSFTNQRHWTH